MNSPHSSATSDIQQSQGIRTGKPKGSAAQYRSARLSMPNTFPARERQFIRTLAEDLHLLVTWDEYDEDDQNIVTWQFPGALEQPLPEEAQKTNSDAEGEGEWEDVDDDDDDDEESKAVDRVLKKYEKVQV
jgi:5'-3' exoribonuclease 1